MHTCPSNKLSRLLRPLEDRAVPAWTIDVDDGIMRITGDNEANALTVTHDGAGNVTAVCDGTTATGEDIERIVIDLRGGADTVVLNGTGELTEELALVLNLGAGNDTADLNFAAVADELSVRADGGAGDDLIDVNLDQEIRAGAEVRVDVRGRDGADTGILSVNEVREGAELWAWFAGDAGDDAFTAFLGDPLDAGAFVKLVADGGHGDDALTVDASTFGTGVNIGEGAELMIKLNGGNGDDTIRATYEGDVDGELKLQLDGDDGNDTVSADVIVSAGSTGEAHARVGGAKGDDILTLNLTDDSDEEAEVKGRIDGGQRFDTCTSTPNVDEKHCEA